MTYGTARETWQAVLGEIQLQVTRPIYDTWLKDTHGISISNDLLAVGVSSPFISEWLEKRLYQMIRKSLYRVVQRPVDIEFHVMPSRNEPMTGTHYPGEPARPQPSIQSPIRTKISHRYTLDNFVVGPSNQLSHGAACAVASSPFDSYNPLFLYSGVGLGKTHLLQAIGNSCIAQGHRVIYTTCEQFTNEFILAIRQRTTEQFRSKYRGVQVLLIDDIQFLCGKEQTQEGFFHTFNALHNDGHLVVIASDTPPQALPLLEERLRSRFAWGLIADIHPPDLETRMAILQTKAHKMGLDIDASLIELIAKRIHSNVRELEGSLNRIAALSRQCTGGITSSIVTEAISTYSDSRPVTRSVDPITVIDEVCRKFTVSKKDIVGPSRRQLLTTPRHIAMYLLHEDYNIPLSSVGKLLGKRDHSTVTNAVGKIRLGILEDPLIRKTVSEIQQSLVS